MRIAQIFSVLGVAGGTLLLGQAQAQPYGAYGYYDAYPGRGYYPPPGYYAPYDSRRAARYFSYRRYEPRPEFDPRFVEAPAMRPASCGRYRYWNGEYCADARFERPYVGPKY